MQNVKKSPLALRFRQDLLQIKEHTTFAQTFRLIKKDKQLDVIWVKKPKASQMSAVLLHKLSGRKFQWIQNFENPPVPNFLARLLLNQSDEILVSSRRMATKLKSLGVEKPKIKLLVHSS